MASCGGPPPQAFLNIIVTFIFFLLEFYSELLFNFTGDSISDLQVSWRSIEGNLNYIDLIVMRNEESSKQQKTVKGTRYMQAGALTSMAYQKGFITENKRGCST